MSASEESLDLHQSMGKKAGNPAYVVGVGLTKFIKPRGKVDYHELGFEAGIKALLDAHLNYDDIETGIACYVYGDSTCGQRTFYTLGMTGIPIYNVNNNCSTGSTGLHMARSLVSHGAADAVLVIGFEKMNPGSLQTFFQDRTNPIDRSFALMQDTVGITNAPGAAQLFGNAGREYMQRFGAEAKDFAEIARINHEHSSRNPYSQFRDVYSLEEVLESPEIHAPLTKLQCCPTSDGGGAVVVVSEAFLQRRPDLREQAILIAGQSLVTDSTDVFDRSAMNLIGYGMTQRAAKAAMEEAGVKSEDINICELHDCFSANEMVTLDALGLCEHGTAHEMVRRGDITFGGKCVVNPSGGLISKGHPLGATGLAQCAELVWQLRGWANNRLVKGTSVVLQHNLGLGGAAVVTVYKRADAQRTDDPVSDEVIKQKSGVGYNPATEARGFTKEQVEQVRSRESSSEWALNDTERRVEARF